MDTEHPSQNDGDTNTLPVSDTWIFDTESLSWTQRTASPDHPRHFHTAVQCNNNSVMIIGGTTMSLIQAINSNVNVGFTPFCKDVHYIRLEPDSLKKLSLKAVFENRDVLQDEWKDLPADLYADLREMCELKL